MRGTCFGCALFAVVVIVGVVAYNAITPKQVFPAITNPIVTIDAVRLADKIEAMYDGYTTGALTTRLQNAPTAEQAAIIAYLHLKRQGGKDFVPVLKELAARRTSTSDQAQTALMRAAKGEIFPPEAIAGFAEYTLKLLGEKR